MRIDEVAKDRRSYLVPAFGHPHALALVAPPTPRRLPPDRYHRGELSEAHTALGRLQGALEHMPDSDMVQRILSCREAVMSSQIEGARSTFRQLLVYSATRDAAGMPDDVRMTERCLAALQVGLERVHCRGCAALDLALINEVHAVLMAQKATPHPIGAYRRDQVWIGPTRWIEDATFVPAPPARVEECMREMAASTLGYVPLERRQVRPSILAQLAIVHAQFQTIHPYHDGNGHIGRMLFPLMLAAAAFPPLYLSGALLRAKSEYDATLASVQLRSKWGPWCELLGRAVVQSCEVSIFIAEDLRALAEGWEQELGSYRADSATRRLPRFLIGNPVISVQQAATGLDISVPAANGALNNLLAAGIVSLVDQRRWGRLFQASQVLYRVDQATLRLSSRVW